MLKNFQRAFEFLSLRAWLGYLLMNIVFFAAGAAFGGIDQGINNQLYVDFDPFLVIAKGAASIVNLNMALLIITMDKALVERFIVSKGGLPLLIKTFLPLGEQFTAVHKLYSAAVTIAGILHAIVHLLHMYRNIGEHNTCIGKAEGVISDLDRYGINCCIPYTCWGLWILIITGTILIMVYNIMYNTTIYICICIYINYYDNFLSLIFS